ncbi:uncharacterized protein LOC120113655 [Hibiscus syriacus]|uniref:uncharacterized protein LOC120113655 n=1 Tax=Hibiscus syriacus TaxID=106335 RepID=UPI001922727E|nr:uncharacterized protein LOC120113655 [Hibiscus syriacus]
MATKVVMMMLIAASFLMGCAVATGVPALQLIHLGGKVMCHDCTKSYAEWTRGTHPIQGCVFPHATCNIPTNFAGGLTGVNLPNRPTVLYRDLVQYQLGTFFYTTQRCAKPAAGDNHDSTGCLAK